MSEDSSNTDHILRYHSDYIKYTKEKHFKYHK